MDKNILAEAAAFRGEWGDPQAELEAVMRQTLRGAAPGADLAAEELNGYFDSQCSGIPVPDQWRWSGGRPEGQFTTGVRSGVIEWAQWAGDGVVRAELLADDVLWADCRVYEYRFTVWGYLPYVEMLDISCLALDFRP